MPLAARQDARKAPIAGPAALRLLRDVDHLYATRGTAVAHVDLQGGRPGERELLALLLGPMGNLRAPTLRTGRVVVVGFDEATYRTLLR